MFLHCVYISITHKSRYIIRYKYGMFIDYVKPKLKNSSSINTPALLYHGSSYASSTCINWIILSVLLELKKANRINII